MKLSPNLEIVTPSSFARDVRFARLFSAGRPLIVAWAHAPLLGPIPGFDRTAMGASEEFGEADGLLLSTAMMKATRSLWARRDRPLLFMLQHWQSLTRPRELRPQSEGSTARMLTVEEAAQWGADGVMTYLYVGWADPDREAREIEYVADVSRQCQQLGLIHIVESCLVGEEDADLEERARMAAYHARLAAELGADIVKTRWTDEATFPAIVDACPVPIFIAGGTPKHGVPEMELEVRNALACGVQGLVYGRYVFQHQEPKQIIRRLLAILRDAELGNGEPANPPFANFAIVPNPVS